MQFPLANLPPSKKLVFLIQDVSRMLRHRLDQVAQKSGLTSAQWRVLASVARCQSLDLEPLNQAALADMLDIEPITLSRQIDRLATAGLIERRPDPNDRLAHRLHLTAKAGPMVEAFRDVGTKMLKSTLEGIAEDDIAVLSATLEKIRTNLTGKVDLALPFADPKSQSEPLKERSVS